MKIWILLLTLLIIPVVSAELWIVTPTPGSRFIDTNFSMNVTTNESFSNCTYSLNEFVPQTCSFNSTNNLSGFFGWNRLEVCGTNTSNSLECDQINIWCDKKDKQTADYFVLLLLLGLGLFFGVMGILRFGLMGIIGGILLFLAGIESIALGINTVAYGLILFSVLVMIGSVLKR